MKPFLFLFAAMLLTGVQSAARADDAVDGTLRVTLKNADYVKVTVNGNDWTDLIEFERDGKVVLVKGLSTTLDHNLVTLTPITPDLQAIDVEVTPKEFKRQRRGRDLILVATRTVSFPKATVPTPPKTPAQPTEPTPPPAAPDDDL